MLQNLINASIISIVGVVWVLMLVRTGEILDFIPAWFWKVFTKNGNHVTPAYAKIHKMLFQCEKCASGQLALWGYPISVHSFGDIKYNPFDHFVLVILAIFMARVVGGLISKYL
jgi:hypothetical protein